ncbi:hypothetical protein CR513_23515, partial [Mucuna pruriens]
MALLVILRKKKENFCLMDDSDEENLVKDSNFDKSSSYDQLQVLIVTSSKCIDQIQGIKVSSLSIAVAPRYPSNTPTCRNHSDFKSKDYFTMVLIRSAHDT